jgi:predicted Zn-dependent peptidase
LTKGVEITRLPGGLRVVSHRMARLETVSLGIWANAGARHEAADEHGLAHLMEHMAFKGTASRSALDIAASIEAVGGDINAATSLETTAYFARLLKADLALGVEILADIVQNPVYDPAELAREKQVVAQEIGAARDTPEDLVFDLFQQAGFPDQPLGRAILGTERSLARLKSDHLERFRSAHYARPGLVLSAAGALDHDRLVGQVEHALNGIGAHQPPRHAPARFQSGELRRQSSLEQAHVVLGFEGLSYMDEQVYAAQILAAVLGGGMSSRLFQEVREKRGLAYSIYAFSWSFADSGLFGVYAATDPGNLTDLIAVLAEQLELIKHGVAPHELERARAQAKSSLAMSLESTGARAEQMARQVQMFDRVLPRQELISRIERITAEDLAQLAQRLLVNDKLVIAGVGKLEGLASYDEIAALFTKRRG